VIIEKWANYGGFETRELIVDGVGSPVILLHGFADSAETWLAVLAGLAEQGRAAHAYDLPGFGSADALDPGPVLVQLDRFVSAVVATHRAGGPVLIGNSLGAILALRAACEPDTSIKRVVAMGVPTAYRPLVRTLIGRQSFTSTLTRLPVPSGLLARTERQILRRGLYGSPRAGDAEVIERFRSQVPDRHALRRLLQNGQRFEAEVTGAVEPSQVGCPVTVVHGSRDRLIPVRASRGLHAGLSDSTLVVLARVGHCPQLDAPDKVVDLVVCD